MSMRIGKALAGVIFACGLSAISVYAHEVPTHQNIGDVAVAYISKTQPSRPLLLGGPAGLQATLRLGAAQEDDDPLPGVAFPVGRYFFHFDPELSFSLLGLEIIGASCTSEEWGLIDNGVCATTCEVPFVCSVSAAPFTNAYRWSQDLTADQTGAPSPTSIRQFGYLVHLLEDLGSPAHTRNDMHACPPQLQGLLYCDPFEKVNEGRSPDSPTGNALIPTSGFTTPNNFFTSLKEYTSGNYYSDNTVFQGPGPSLVTQGLQYFYGDCIAATTLYGNCGTANGYGSVRKIAAKGPLYWAVCAATLFLACDDTKGMIDRAIAQEQFNELGPVIAQHVAAFVMFYAPALTVNVTGTGTDNVTSNPGNLNCTAANTPCSSLFAQTQQGAPSITLTATPASGSMFVGWSGACSGNSPSITISLASDETCTATFQAFWSGRYSVTTCNTPGYIGSGDPCSYIVWSLPLGSGGHGTRSAGLYIGPSGQNNVRYEQQFDGEFCSAGSGVDLSQAGSWQDTEDLTNVFLAASLYGPQSVTLSFSGTQRTATMVSGTFAGTFNYPIASGVAQGAISGQWNVTPLSAAFPKCLTNGFEWCYENGYAVNALSGNGGSGTCSFLYPKQPAPPGEWP